jgi:arylsulfatase A-like enzyme
VVTSNLGNQAYRLLSKYGNRYLEGLLGFVDLPGRKLAGPTIDSALDWIGQLEGQPFFGFLNLYDAHAPYNPPGLESYLERVSETPDAPAYAEGSAIASYDGGIAYMDRELERLFDELSRSGLLENTLVIITSDHGEEFGEHGLFGHGDSLFWPSIRVPLIVRLPGAQQGGTRRVSPVSLTEIPAFVLAQLAPGVSHTFPMSATLLADTQDTVAPAVFSTLRAGSNHIDGTPIARGDMYSLVTPDLHYVRYGDGVEEVYRYRLDPDEHDDLGETEALALRSRLSRFVGQNQDDWSGANDNLRWRVPGRQSFPATPPARTPGR